MSYSALVSRSLLLAALFGVGFLLMGYEMLGSRFLNPYFGSGITTWACLISVVLLAMMVGYFSGGFVVDARPGIGAFGISACCSGVLLLSTPLFVDRAFAAILREVGDGFWGVLIAASAISFVPIALLSACSPIVVRMLLVDLQSGGRVSGIVYSISTLGNVIGTLATTFILIPNYGVRAITYAFGAALCLLGLGVLALRVKLETSLKAAVLVVIVGLAGGLAGEANAQAVTRLPALYPEGPLWVGSRLYYAEMGAHRVTIFEGGSTRTFWSEQGCGPTAIAEFASGFVVLCHMTGKLVQVTSDGKQVRELAAASSGERLRNPNDCHLDDQGGVIFTDPGLFSAESSATGKVFRLGPSGAIVKLLDGLHYANGVAFDPARRRVLVSEHLARKVWSYQVDAEWRLVDKKLFLDVDQHLPGARRQYAEVGPDGIEIDKAGAATIIPVYGSGVVLVVMDDGRVRKFPVPMRFVTNVAVSADAVVVVGAYVNDRQPLAGAVVIYSRQSFYGGLQ